MYITVLRTTQSLTLHRLVIKLNSLPIPPITSVRKGVFSSFTFYSICFRYIYPTSHPSFVPFFAYDYPSLVKLIHIEHTHKWTEQRVNKLIESYETSDLVKTQREKQITRLPPAKESKEHYHGYAQSFPTQVKYLYRRTVSDTLREPLK